VTDFSELPIPYYLYADMFKVTQLLAAWVQNLASGLEVLVFVFEECLHGQV